VICDLVRIRRLIWFGNGMIAQEGPGPVSGMPRMMRLIVGHDAVAIDHVCARLMGKDPACSTFRLAAKHNLGHSYELLVPGEDVARIRFYSSMASAWMWLGNY